MQRRRWIRLVLFLAVILIVIAYGFRPKPLLVDTIAVQLGLLQETVREEGKSRVIDRFVISAPVSGLLRRIEMDVGDPVVRGQTLVTLEPLPSTVLDPRSRAEAEARVAATEAALRRAQSATQAAQADAELAASELTRIRGLYAEGFASREQLDQAETEAQRRAANRRSAQFTVKVARFEAEAARTALKYSAAEGTPDPLEVVTLRAPVDARILKIHRESEGVVRQADPLIEIGDPRALEIEVDVLSADAVRIRPGLPVQIERWGGDTTLEARVKTVEPVGFTKISALGVEEQRVYVIAQITSPEAAWVRLGDGYRVEAAFILWEGEDVLQVPTSALFRHGKGWAVFTVAGGRARLQPVEIGHRSGFTAEILSGLSTEDVVITHPNDTIESGTRVRVRSK